MSNSKFALVTTDPDALVRSYIGQFDVHCSCPSCDKPMHNPQLCCSLDVDEFSNSSGVKNYVQHSICGTCFEESKHIEAPGNWKKCRYCVIRLADLNAAAKAEAEADGGRRVVKVSMPIGDPRKKPVSNELADKHLDGIEALRSGLEKVDQDRRERDHREQVERARGDRDERRAAEPAGTQQQREQARAIAQVGDQMLVPYLVEQRARHIRHAHATMAAARSRAISAPL